MTGEFTLNSPLTKEDWDKIADVEMEKTTKVWFKTPSGKSVEFIPVSVIDAIKAEIKSKKFSGYANDSGSADLPDHQAHFNSGLILALEIIEKHTSGGAE